MPTCQVSIAPSYTQRMTRHVLSAVVWCAFLAACLFGPAQTLNWPMGWAVAVVYVSVVILAFAVLDRELLDERLRPGKNFERADAVVGGLCGVLLYPATLLVAGFDHRLGWSTRVPAAVAIAAVIVFGSGYALALWSMHANRFFSTFVRIQHDRGHHVVDRGPYAWLRHPGYTGTVIAHLTLPIALGSYAALMPATLAAGLFVVRTSIEDRTLAAKLEGYRAYRDRVRWRLVPGLW